MHVSSPPQQQEIKERLSNLLGEREEGRGRKGGKAPYFHFSKEDETGKHNVQKTLVIPISFQPWSGKEMLRSIWTKKGFYMGRKKGAGILFPKPKSGVT